MRYKGRPSQRQLKQHFPNTVEIEIPQFGLGLRVMLIHNWLRLHAGEYSSWSRSDRETLKAYAVYGFASDTDALAFQRFSDSIKDLDHAGIYAMLDQQEAQIGRPEMSHVAPPARGGTCTTTKNPPQIS